MRIQWYMKFYMHLTGKVNPAVMGGYPNTGLCRQLQEGVSDALQYIGLCMNNSVTDPSEMQLEQGLYFLAPDFPLGT